MYLTLQKMAIKLDPVTYAPLICFLTPPGGKSRRQINAHFTLMAIFFGVLSTLSAFLSLTWESTNIVLRRDKNRRIMRFKIPPPKLLNITYLPPTLPNGTLGKPR